MNGLTIDKKRTALLIMDYQQDIVSGTPMAVERQLPARAKGVAEAARRVGVPVVYVVVRFREGYPEVSPSNKGFSGIKGTGRLREGTPGAEIHPEVAPQPGDVVVVKRRVGAFSTTDLSTVLKAKGAETLVLAGIATSGVVLSTVRHGADADYELIVLEDLCADRDAEVHRVLTEKVFPRQAMVTTSQEFLKALAG